MSELRRDPLQNLWTVISPGRSRLASGFIAGGSRGGKCPFCPEHGSKELYEIFRINDKDGKWLLRVVPDRYPALGIEGVLGRSSKGFYDVATGIGAHEIIIDSPRHGLKAEEYTEEELYNLFTAFKVRMEDLAKDMRFSYITAFKTIGVEAGDIIGHPHAQIIALPVIPPKILAETEIGNAHYYEKERCLSCDLVEQEMAGRRRVVFENYDFIAFCPFASEYPFQVNVYPKKHSHSFPESSESALKQLAEITREVYSRLAHLLRSPSVMMAIHTSPPKAGRADIKKRLLNIEQSFHWHMEIRPVIIKVPGFQWASGMNVNPVSPEEAAQILKEVVVK